MGIFRNQYTPSDPEPRIGYAYCDVCGRAVPVDEARMVHYGDGEVIKTCDYCPLEDEVVCREPVTEPDYFEDLEPYNYD